MTKLPANPSVTAVTSKRPPVEVDEWRRPCVPLTAAPIRWWDEKIGLNFIEENPAFDRWYSWYFSRTPRPSILATEWSRREQRAIEYCAWIYELDARIRGWDKKRQVFLFGCPICLMNLGQINQILRPAHPMNGSVTAWKSLVDSDPGPALLLPGHRSSGVGGPCVGDATCSMSAWTPWAYVVCRGVRSRVPVSINLAASAQIVAEEFERRQDEIGVNVSRYKVLRHVAWLRANFGRIGPARAPAKGERRREIVWDWIDTLDDFFASAGPEADKLSPEVRMALFRGRKACLAFSDGIRGWDACAELLRRHLSANASRGGPDCNRNAG